MLEAFSGSRHVFMSNFSRQKSQAALFSSLPILFPVSSSDPVSSLCQVWGLFLNLAPTSGSHQTNHLKMYFHCSWQVKKKKVSRVSSFQNLFFFIPTAIASLFCEFLKHLQLHWNLVPGSVSLSTVCSGPSMSCLWGARPYLEEDNALAPWISVALNTRLSVY